MKSNLLVQLGLEDGSVCQQNKGEFFLPLHGMEPRALIAMSAFITGIRNSNGSTTFSQNKGGAYSKNKPIPTNPRSIRQQTVRSQFGVNSKLWSGTLTDAQRAAWNMFAGANPYTNVFGETKQLSGMSMMMKLNQVLAIIGITAITDPPSDLSVLPLAAPFGITSDVVDDTVEIETATQAVVANTKYYIFATGPLQAGKSPGQSDYRFMLAKAPIAAAAVLDITTPWKAAFGSIIAGKRVGCLVSTINTETGATTPGLPFSTIITPS